MSKSKSIRREMPGLRLKGGIWQIEKRSKHAPNGWLRESTGKTSRPEAEKVLIRRLAEIEQAAQRIEDGVYLFEQAAMQYLEDKAHQASAKSYAYHIDEVLPFIGHLPLEHIHDGTLKAYIDHALARGLSAKTINNSIVLVGAILTRASRVWRTIEGKPWLRYAPPKLTKRSMVGQQAKAYPLSWKEQDRLMSELAEHLKAPALFALNTGCREKEICSLRWDWEIKVVEHDVSVFVLPETLTKTRTERIVVLNSIATAVVDNQRGKHDEFVFNFKDRPLRMIHSNGWKGAWQRAGLPTDDKMIQKGVHNLRHTFGRRLRAAGVSLETRKTLLGHANGDITTHYSAAELSELLEAVERIVDRGIAQTPTLALVRNTGALAKASFDKGPTKWSSTNRKKPVGKVSE